MRQEIEIDVFEKVMKKTIFGSFESQPGKASGFQNRSRNEKIRLLKIHKGTSFSSLHQQNEFFEKRQQHKFLITSSFSRWFRFRICVTTITITRNTDFSLSFPQIWTFSFSSRIISKLNHNCENFCGSFLTNPILSPNFFSNTFSRNVSITRELKVKDICFRDFYFAL